MSNRKFFFLALGSIFLLFAACGPKSTQRVSSGRAGMSSSQDRHAQLISVARQYEGSKYKYGGEGPNSFDCSGFTQFVYSEVGVQLPRRSIDQAQYGKKIDVKRAQKGDLLVLKKGRKVQHVGIVVESSDRGLWVTHASTSKGVITENMASSPYWKSRIRYARRVLP